MTAGADTEMPAHGFSGGMLKKTAHFLRNVKHFFSSLDPFLEHGARILAHSLYRLRILGVQEYIPPTGPAILICNHISFVDGLIIHTAIKRKVYYVIDRKIYETPFVKFFLDRCGAIPIEADRDSVAKALEKVRDVLADGHLVCIFPEGYLSRTGNMRRFKFGVEWMAKENKVDIIPMALKGLWGSIYSRKYKGKWHWWIPKTLRRRVTLICGEPIPYQDARVNLLQRRVMELKNSVE